MISTDLDNTLLETTMSENPSEMPNFFHHGRNVNEQMG